MVQEHLTTSKGNSLGKRTHYSKNEDLKKKKNEELTNEDLIDKCYCITGSLPIDITREL